MIAVDTNVVVRLLTQDDEPQYQQALQVFQQAAIFIPDTVILETEWVLRFSYRFPPTAIGAAFRSLLGLPNVHVTNATMLAQVLQWHEAGLDFADALHLAQSQHCSAFDTFDNRFVSRSAGLGECPVRHP
jgi:predicted nucleic-acid-binding protein